MANEASRSERDPSGATAGLQGLTEAAAQAVEKGPPPVHLWNPPFCGDIDMRIAADGTWFYQGSPIGRPAMVKLFSSILRKDPERYVLVTPVERVGIVVEDAPFLAVELAVEPTEPGDGQVLRLRTNVDEWVEVGDGHALRFERGASGGLKPYVHVRNGLWALVKRALFYDLVDLGAHRDVGGTEMFGVASRDTFYPMARADALEALA